MSVHPTVFLVVDPVQDWEESLEIYGVYGSLAASNRATPRLRRIHLRDGPERRWTEIQQWQGDLMLASWAYCPDPENPLAGWTEGVPSHD